MQIGVLIDEGGNVTSLDQGGTVVIYNVQEEKSDVAYKLEYRNVSELGASVIRTSLHELAAFLGDCKVLVVREINGIYFTVLEGLLFSLWEMDANPSEFLHYIYEGELEAQSQAKEKSMATTYAPIDKGRGSYEIDLEKVMNRGVTSKKVLLPFLEKESFKALEVKCSHIPRWFDTELSKLMVKYESEKTADGYLVTLTPDIL
jgi:Fe-only nitrogenase accessory protein AnfO